MRLQYWIAMIAALSALPIAALGRRLAAADSSQPAVGSRRGRP